jgi:hypothetical protein
MSGQSITFKPSDIQGETTFAPGDIAPATPEPTPPADLGSPTGRFLSNAGAMLNPISALMGLLGAVRHPINTAMDIGRAQVDQGQQAITAGKEGRYSEMAGHGLASLLPILGPAAAAAGEQIGSGDVAGGLGTGAGLLATMGAPAAIRGARKVASPLLNKAIPALEASANADVTTALNPTRHRTKVKTERIASEVRQRGITGDIEEVKGLAKDQRHAVGERIDQELTIRHDVPVELQPVREALLREEASTHNLVTQPDGTSKKVVHNPRKQAQIDKVKDILNDYGDTMTTEQAVALRKTWDDVVARAGGYDEKASNQFGVTLDDASEAGVKRKVAGAMRKQLAEANPDITAINREFKFWADLDDVASATTSRRVGQKRNLTKQIMRAGTMATGAASGTGIPGAILAGEVAARAEALFGSTKWKLASAQMKTKLADALASGDRDRIAAAIGRITAGVNATSPRGSRTAPESASVPQH